MEKDILVFVYGTLLSGEINNRLLETSEKLGSDVISGYVMLNLGMFPALIPEDNASTPITGEVWKVSTATFQRLDVLEGYPHFYNREQVDTFAGKAWVYYMHERSAGMRGEIISHGNWKMFRAGKK